MGRSMLRSSQTSYEIWLPKCAQPEFRKWWAGLLNGLQNFTLGVSNSIKGPSFMSDEKHLVIHFNNGNKMEVSFPTQIKNSMGALVEVGKRILEADKLVIQTEQQTIIIPWSSVQYLEAAAVPTSALPIGAIKGA